MGHLLINSHLLLLPTPSTRHIWKGTVEMGTSSQMILMTLTRTLKTRNTTKCTTWTRIWCRRMMMTTLRSEADSRSSTTTMTTRAIRVRRGELSARRLIEARDVKRLISWLHKNSNKRVPRDVPVHVSSSVPIIEESYAAVRRNKTNSGPAMDHLTELLLKRSASPKMHYDWDQKSKEGLVASCH